MRLRLWRLLPGWLRRILPESFIGFAILNLTTFAVDMAVLAALFRLAQLPYPLATTIGYLTALVLAYFLNRWLNFHSHGAVGPQSARYVFVAAVNYFALLQGVGSGLQALGVNFLLARIIAACCEGIWTYVGMRWIVFRTDGRSEAPAAPAASTTSVSTTAVSTTAAATSGADPEDELEQAPVRS
ncbi:Putative flippase GtrA (transmembrane translocase of bactoprenol-linked glucose) [Raineyella antarctica]|uniref:Putative flippase GtrA (Transmembrane translocase of bactoprenol-linked glucose) n=2 Tax=Raineyella antarctica TaxID=1577474 RepID=A0A1G6GME6_9ACTN|nr:Putative flippase GtrA (transmembrane translocase of bactoprenol-linked glucose) [Raineyella antarctica]